MSHGRIIFQPYPANEETANFPLIKGGGEENEPPHTESNHLQTSEPRRFTPRNFLHPLLGIVAVPSTEGLQRIVIFQMKIAVQVHGLWTLQSTKTGWNPVLDRSDLGDDISKEANPTARPVEDKHPNRALRSFFHHEI